jgi:membrane-associated phospholipid phosphatase
MTFTLPVLVSPKSSSVWAVPVLTAIAFAILLASGENRQVFLLVNSIGAQTSDDLWANITILGDTTVALALCLPLWRRRPDLLWALVIGAACCTAWVHVLKPLFEVPRPPAVLADAVHVIGPAYRAGSFPSGHATTSFALAGLMVMALGWRAASVGALCIASVAALSRSVVGVHWPLDVLAGAFGGWLSAFVGLWLAQRTPAVGRKPWVRSTVAVVLAGGCVALVVGVKTGYPQAVWFERGLGVLSLAVTATLWWRDRRADRRQNG